MNPFNTIKFGDLYSIPSRNGVMRPKGVRGEGYKMINMGELFKYPRINDQEMELVKLDDKEKEVYGIENGDLLFARQSLVLEGAGKCAVVVDIEKPATFESHLIRVRLNKELANPLFYFYYFSSNTGLASVQTLVNQVAAAGIRGSDLTKLDVLHPDLVVQEKIAAILSAYDDLIENNKRRIALLEKMAEEIYREWFVRFRFPGYQTAEFEKGRPKGWDVKKLPEVASITYGFPFQSNRFNEEGVGKPIIRIRNIPNSSTNDYTDEVVDDKYLVKTGDLVVGMDGEFHINHWYGEEAYLVQRVCRIKAKESYLSGYLSRAIRAPIKHYEAILLGATVGHLGAKHLNAIDILIPPDELMPHLERFNELEAQKRNLAIMNRQLGKIKSSLLPRLISGKLSVERLDIQFPPSMISNEAA